MIARASLLSYLAMFLVKGTSRIGEVRPAYTVSWEDPWLSFLVLMLAAAFGAWAALEWKGSK